jgi:para-aminobenzoate synthetase component I
VDYKQLFSLPIINELAIPPDHLIPALLSLPAYRHVSILDSCGVATDGSAYLIAAFDPFLTVESKGSEILVRNISSCAARRVHGDCLDLLDTYLKQFSNRLLIDFPFPATGFCVATLSYELLHTYERLRTSYVGSMSPDLVLHFYNTFILHNYSDSTTYLVTTGGPERYRSALSAISSAIAVKPFAFSESKNPTISSNFSKAAYIDAVRKIKDHIEAGDIYQANLTQKFTVETERSPEEIFLRLRKDNPVPFSAYVRRRDSTVVSSSPERFLKVSSDRTIKICPVKGTRRRGETEEQDRELCRELLKSEKDRAENIMIVDLVRNDIGRVCNYGTVEVKEICSLQKNPNLFHLVSTVTGQLRDDVTAGAIIRAAFPCGSITGAPKIRAMEILNDIEHTPRGISMGSIGYFSFDGSMDLNVAIRTMIIKDGRAVFNVGGGIVWDSDPLQEYEESLLKARPLLQALGG